MRKYLILMCMAMLTVFAAGAQPVTISGTVQDNTGNFLHYAFVHEIHARTGVYTDSVGRFFIQVEPNAVLNVNCSGYKDASVSLTGQNELVITLQPDAAAEVNAATDAGANNTALQDALAKEGTLLNKNTVAADFQQGSAITIIHTKEETQGSPYFFKRWSHGYVINAQDSMIQNPSFLLNYNKMNGMLLLTKDGVSMISVDRDKVKSFTLFDVLNQPHTFAIVPVIDKTHYVEVIAKGNNYCIYKGVKTKFVASNYASDGIASTGNNFDAYEDEFTYYIINVKTNQVQKVNLRKKALKQAFASEEKKADDFFKTNDGDIDDSFLAAMGDYMNK